MLWGGGGGVKAELKRRPQYRCHVRAFSLRQMHVRITDGPRRRRGRQGQCGGPLLGHAALRPRGAESPAGADRRSVSIPGDRLEHNPKSRIRAPCHGTPPPLLRGPEHIRRRADQGMPRLDPTKAVFPQTFGLAGCSQPLTEGGGVGPAPQRPVSTSGLTHLFGGGCDLIKKQTNANQR